MKKLILFLSVGIIGWISTSCAKDGCDSASVCMVNNTSDTVYYSWNSNLHDMMLPPGESACREVGELQWNESFTTFFESDKGSYALDVEDCEETYFID